MSTLTIRAIEGMKIRNTGMGRSPEIGSWLPSKDDGNRLAVYVFPRTSAPGAPATGHRQKEDSSCFHNYLITMPNF